MQLLMNRDRIGEVIGELAERIVGDSKVGCGGGRGGGVSGVISSLALVGIRSRGEILAQRLGAEIERRLGQGRIDVGALDITMYRDDLASGRAIQIPRGTDMNFRLDGRAVILVDDVLQTGRSVRAALDALVDFGRPRLIRLAVLVDRGMREFPIAADYAGLEVAGDVGQKVVVHLRPTDGEDGVYLQTEPA